MEIKISRDSLGLDSNGVPALYGPLETQLLALAYRFSPDSS